MQSGDGLGHGVEAASSVESSAGGDPAAEQLREIAASALSVEALASYLPATWRRSRFRVVGLEKAAHYNGLEAVATGLKADRVTVQVQNEARSQLCVRRRNLELVDARLDEEEDPSLCQALQRLALCRAGEATREGVAGAARNWAQGLLDVTFAIENILVDAEFSDRAAFDEVSELLASIERRAVALTAAWPPSSDDHPQEDGGDKDTAAMVHWFGDGLAECVHWRRGALAYMLTATLAADRRPLPRPLLLQGLRELDRMVATRGDGMKASVADAEGSEGVRMMLLEGILSDTHLLAVVYGGEMCYWGTQEWSFPAEEEEGGGDRAEEVGGLRAKGVALLTRYIKCVEVMTEGASGGVGAGWDTARAQQLLAELQR